jgi:hypothetical protein
MTSKTDFTADEWKLVLEAPPTAGLMVVMAQRGGMLRESLAMAKAYTEARREHGNSQLLDDIVAAKPERDHTRVHSYEELRTEALQHLRDAMALLRTRATPEEVAEYRRFVVTLAQKVASAHREHGQDVSEAEAAAVRDIEGALGDDAR